MSGPVVSGPVVSGPVVSGPVISAVLVANRGEIARRVFRTCRQAGLGTVAVFSDPDAGAPHVADADRAVRLPGASPADTYLNGPALVAAALAAGADAVHPGYGFLAEDAGFARQVTAAGLTWTGPPPEAMEALALKINARKLAAAAGVPVLPELDPATVSTFPVLVKASAGGGGRGMRAVAGPEELASALESARREAQAAFGDGTVFCEPLLTGARHIEVQVMADGHGTVWALTERDCSVQRRYQKVIEESPSPAVGPELRQRLRSAAASLARAVGYTGAGTVEFLVGGGDEFYFLEFNTRLQVEHPVTECVHGIDLVALQLDVAAGGRLPDQPPSARGHSIEARLYAEDPTDGFRPSAGTVHAFAIPSVDVRFSPVPAGTTGPVLRLDSGTEPGQQVSPHYDAMLAKVITWAPDRAAAARRLAAALSGARVAGPVTNRDLLVSVLRDPRFTAGRADTSLLAGYDLPALIPSVRSCKIAAVAAAVAAAAASRAAASAASALPGGWRNVFSQPQRLSFDGPRGRADVAYRWTRDGGITVADVSAHPLPGAADGADRADGADEPVPEVLEFGPDRATLTVAGVRYRFDVLRADGTTWVDSGFGSVRLRQIERLPEPAVAAAPGSLLAPMPGAVVRVLAEPGDRVADGQLIVVLEAMKMEHRIAAPTAGVLAEIRAAAGTQVNAGDVLAIVTPDEPEEAATTKEAR